MQKSAIKSEEQKENDRRVKKKKSKQASIKQYIKQYNIACCFCNIDYNNHSSLLLKIKINKLGKKMLF